MPAGAETVQGIAIAEEDRHLQLAHDHLRADAKVPGPVSGKRCTSSSFISFGYSMTSNILVMALSPLILILNSYETNPKGFKRRLCQLKGAETLRVFMKLWLSGA